MKDAFTITTLACTKLTRSQPYQRPARWLNRLLAGLAYVQLAACDTGASTESLINQSLINTGSTSTLALSAPPFLVQTRAIDLARLIVEVSVNGNAVDMQRQGDQWRGEINVPAGEVVSIELVWLEVNADGAAPLRLATYMDTIGPLSAPVSLPLGVDDYVSEGIDDDQDNISNLEERREGTNPRDASDPQRAPADDGNGDSIDVVIPEISSSQVPVIDGRYESVWNSNNLSDTEGRQLSIDNLLVGEPISRTDGNTEFEWTAMHDGTYLYVLVKGENVEGATLFADSVSAWKDDSLELYIDGDNSKFSTYDQVNDFLFVLPHLKLLEPLEANNSFDLDGRIRTGFHSTPLPEDFTFATCLGLLCSGDSNIWEIRVNLEQVGIVKGRPFGFELQLNDDRNGGERDVKWGWIHPSLAVEGAARDSTWQNPSLMGTAVLQ